eukprot:TRINITY_DN66729_c0_g2_i1.p1 TRINITY_DN66729_c0_g2~~TRINITY_DN66729_c0_g2_i1.p1  ORF type:complete len:195 (+),score=47.35 TRINITY_DN66729_c0_g2_i1:327-911(+)
MQMTALKSKAEHVHKLKLKQKRRDYVRRRIETYNFGDNVDWLCYVNERLEWTRLHCGLDMVKDARWWEDDDCDAHLFDDSDDDCASVSTVCSTASVSTVSTVASAVSLSQPGSDIADDDIPSDELEELIAIGMEYGNKLKNKATKKKPKPKPPVKKSPKPKPKSVKKSPKPKKSAVKKKCDQSSQSAPKKVRFA